MTIPVSDLMDVNPAVIGAGGVPLSMNGVIVTQNSLIPAGSVPSFGSLSAVGSYFGQSSDEYDLAQVYFLGFENSPVKPGTLFFAPYHASDVTAWLGSGSLAGISLTTLQGYSGTLILTVDGDLFTSSSISLAAASSFSNAATLIAAGFSGDGAPTCSWDSTLSRFVLHSTTSGVGSTITYCTGTLATNLKFTSATGAVISQGAAASTPASAMANVIANTTNFVSFMTLFEPDLAHKESFAIWANGQNQRYAYVAWDTDAQAIVQGSTTNFGYVADLAEYNAVMPLYNTKELAAFAISIPPSTNFNQTNGRTVAAFRSQSGLALTVTDQQISKNLLANGYSYYGEYKEGVNNFNVLYNGQISGKWAWFDTFVDQVYLNSQFRLALMTLFTNVPSVPYNEPGYSLIRAALQDPINSGLNFGSIRAGIILSAAQKAEVNQQAGLDAASIIQQQGYYLQILDPGSQVRGERGTPVINFWYTDGGSVQKISMASIDIM
jgi:Protein of unknown function (DUF3383)